MKKLISFTIALTVTLIASLGGLRVKGQHSIDSIQLYYAMINKAELAIVDSSFDAAINFYNEEFQLKCQIRHTST
ncbi:MAG: hypothetical protein BGO31_12945 [Bacteroidetes bacterium 43-16]|nr:MAG: hypothetical protein BGO31_12945 [Bacteroidetes bacterium 43-16]